MKKLLIIISVICISIFSFMLKTKAYVYVETDNPFGTFKPQETNALLSGWNWNTGVNYNQASPFMVSIGPYQGVGAVHGTYLNVAADYYFGIRVTSTNSLVYGYYNTPRDTLTSQNLRCGIGDYKQGYDSSYAPQITNFTVEYTSHNVDLTDYYLVHVKFNYSQQIKEVNKSSTNVSCWFDRNPSNGLFYQVDNFGGMHGSQYYSYQNIFAVVVSSDPNTKLLNEITSQNQTIIDQNQQIINQGNQTNEKLDNLNDNIKNDNIDTSGANSFFDDFNSKDHGGLSSIITSPLSAFSKITQTCTPVNLNVWDKDITLPCGDTLFWNKESVSSFRIIWNILIGGPLLYFLLVKLYKTIEALKNPDDDRIEVSKL